ncbi:cation/calcium exchanger 2 [Juglans microcarpa x Juglans regia]|uniref:cation/calcium exchanger 2 n=1 Tax=Juglans microcarpa x Juglans regia TaxID=2249226 RepID=UPI001B7E179F|nr:cation/calcium exchanger 2 [Juglans microcarpa x Juglans regia]
MRSSVSLSVKNNYPIFLNVSFVVVVCFFLLIHFHSSESLVMSNFHRFKSSSPHGCKGLFRLDDYKAKCLYLKSHNPCVSQGYIDYLYLFYCKIGSFPLLGYTLFFLWLLVLFYLLGNTASEYFCSSLESLSGLLKLPPTIAGATLLSLGNGAPDFFASFVSFTGNGTRGIGLYTVLGGASFVTCVVVGIISITSRRRHLRLNKSAFIRDVCFFLLVLVSLLVILIQGRIDLWGAIGFSSLYVVYVILVCTSRFQWKNGGEDGEREGNLSDGSDLSIPILTYMGKGDLNTSEEGSVEGESEEVQRSFFCLRSSAFCGTFLCVLEMPLSLPRRLTIPVVCEEKWSKKYAVASVTLAPLLLSALCNPHHENDTFYTRLVVHGIGLLFGIAFGVLAYMTTEKSSPPKQCIFPWLAGGFVMSVTWSYITAQELVGLLVSLGYICGIDPSILGFTVLAWGNSLGDLTSNLTMALNGGPEGTQVAISGCYAGPIFSTLFGLGLALVASSWSNYPSCIEIPKDPYLLETLGFLAGGLLWALVVLPRRGMRLDGVLGGGLLAVYLISLSLRLRQTRGSLRILHTNAL